MAFKNAGSLVAELAVIVFGILIAFQVDEFRETLQERRDLKAAMNRLLDESNQNLEICADWSVTLAANSKAVQHVYQSIAKGEIINGDEKLFRQGLLNVDVVPDIRMLTSSAEEMIATGLLKEVEKPELRRSIALLPTLDQQTRDLLPYWRTGIVNAVTELVETVEFSYAEPMPDFASIDPGNLAHEKLMRVQYDFALLSANIPLRNHYFNAVDVHEDLRSTFHMMCGVVESTREQLIETIAADS